MATDATPSIDSIRSQLPPRHALESDSEEESNSQRHDVQYKESDVSFIGSGIEPKPTLIVVNGHPGAVWAKSADPGDEIGTVVMGSPAVGMVCKANWTSANIMVSEIYATLPVSAKHAYAQAIIDKFRPERVALLDEYSVSTYISDQPVSSQDAPIRYLSTTDFDPGVRAEPFASPNVIKTTSAAFMSILSTQTTCSGTLILLPRPQIKERTPLTIEQINYDTMEGSYTWPEEMMDQADNLLVNAIGESQSRKWRRATDPQLGEGGMYI